MYTNIIRFHENIEFFHTTFIFHLLFNFCSMMDICNCTFSILEMKKAFDWHFSIRISSQIRFLTHSNDDPVTYLMVIRFRVPILVVRDPDPQ